MSDQYHSLINGEAVAGDDGSLWATDPATGAATGPEFTALSEAQVDEACLGAALAERPFRQLTPTDRAAFLRTAAQNLEDRGEAIITTAMAETGLPRPRLTGELARTVNQLRMFAGVVIEGSYLGVRIEPSLPDRSPLPRPDLRQRKIPLGPVAVFGASNFPLAFSVAGGDTASALAAGCPVVFKAHNAHPATSQLVGQAITEAAATHHLPEGVFSLIYGQGNDVGQALVRDPRIKAVGFTGSRRGGTALMATAAARQEPIPVYAEMSAVNPVFILGSALKDADTLATGFVGSLTGSAGQLCTAPGLLFVPKGEAGDTFLEQVGTQLGQAAGTTMLTPGICAARQADERQLAAHDGVVELVRGNAGETQNAPAPALYSTDAETFLGETTYINDSVLAQEVFGAVCLVVRYNDLMMMSAALVTLEGQLTATLHVDPRDSDDAEHARSFIEVAERRAGRVLFNSWPTGVDVGDAIVHGGPYPATSDGRSTSVGTAAIDRWLRPVAYQNIPGALLPEALQDENPWSVSGRRVGVLDG